MIVIIDYGMGNLFSVQSALNYLGVQSMISADLQLIAKADKLILPGVGSFFQAMDNIKSRMQYQAIRESVLREGKPILGICLGMQLLCQSSTEDGLSEGLALVDGPVERFSMDPSGKLKIPHVGFESVAVNPRSKLMRGLGSHADFYFTHSYRLQFKNQPFAAATCRHIDDFVAAFEKDNICGTQFHPEKSQSNGLQLLRNFVEHF